MPAREGEPPDRAASFFRGRGGKERPQPAPGLAVGKVVGDFRLAALLGQGGMGQVWEAQQVSLQRTVAVKFVRPERVTEKQLELFAREARAGGRLHHPGIVTIHGYGQSDGLAWIAMEFVPGGVTLKDFLDEAVAAGEVPEGYDRHVARFVAEIAEAMQAAHEAGVIHRDLKPQNVLITEGDQPKVTDFGLARLTDESALSQTGDFAGTYMYMSPEQVTAKRMGIDHRTDVFSLGIVLYELLTLRRPFEGDTSHQVAEQIVTKDPPDPRSIRSRVPRDLAVIALKALEKDRDKRFESMRELAADLRRYLNDEPIHATPPTRVDRIVKWTRRNPGKSSAAAIAVVTVSVISWLLVVNVRTNRALETERANLSNANSALKDKTTALEEKTKESEDRRVTAEAAAVKERLAAEEATRKRDEVLRLSALQRLDDLTAEARELWPPEKELLPRYAAWLDRARRLVKELPDHEAKRAELRAKALPWSAEDQARHRASHPKLAELRQAEGRRSNLVRFQAALGATTPQVDPIPAEVGLDVATLPATAEDLNTLAWPLVDPNRKESGGEARGLVLARRAVEATAGLSAPERAAIRDSLAWALFANGRCDEAQAEARLALAEAGDAKRAEYEGYLADLTMRIERSRSPERVRQRAEEISSLAGRIEALEAEISARPTWSFADDEDAWWHNQIDKLVEGLRAFGDPATGLLSEGISSEHGWGVVKREGHAATIQERSLSGAEPRRLWTEGIAAIAQSEKYRGVKWPGGALLTPQVGLLPIGADPDSGLWEFAHLASGDPAERGADGKLVVTESMGVVLVLLPGGTFTMGAQSTDPSATNYDPAAESSEGPPHEVTLSPFFLSKYELTQGQWLRLLGSNPSQYGPHDHGSDWNRAGRRADLAHPVERVSWTDVLETTRRYSLTLPSEAQWEYGARAGTTSIWWTGDEVRELSEAGNISDSYAKDHGGGAWGNHQMDVDDGNVVHARVGSYRPNAFGLHEVIGNLWEWCLDGYRQDAYAQLGTTEPVADPAGSSNRVYRGGGFNFPASFARSALRNLYSPSGAAFSLGVRPARRITP